jgi:flagellar basal-body rod protein FlgB
MNLGIETTLGEQVGRYLDLASDQAKLTAANMANIDTPGYKTLGMNFEAEMRKAMTQVDNDQPESNVAVNHVDGLITRPDGNNVSMDRESLNLAEAQLKFKTGVALMRMENQKVLDAIHVQDK